MEIDFITIFNISEQLQPPRSYFFGERFLEHRIRSPRPKHARMFHGHQESSVPMPKKGLHEGLNNEPSVHQAGYGSKPFVVDPQAGGGHKTLTQWVVLGLWSGEIIWRLGGVKAWWGLLVNTMFLLEQHQISMRLHIKLLSCTKYGYAAMTLLGLHRFVALW